MMKWKSENIFSILLLLLLTFSFGFSEKSSIFSITPLTSVTPYMDVRWKDLRSVKDLSESTISTLDFNKQTIWPRGKKKIANRLLKAGMNPGLGIKGLHKKGITGAGVTLAIIDQKMYLDHPEFKGKILKYVELGCSKESASMHGPGVTSLLVGKNIGTTPGANIYYAAVTTIKLDAEYYAEALEWLIAENKNLSYDQKIRIVSVSAAPSGKYTYYKNIHRWDEACEKAAQDGILVLDCTEHRGIVKPCCYNRETPEAVSRCIPGFLGIKIEDSKDDTHIYAPNAFRTQAEEYNPGKYSYQFTGRGGVSWSIPYVAGVLALGLQVRPELSNATMVDLLFKSAYMLDEKYKIINPVNFIDFVIAY